MMGKGDQEIIGVVHSSYKIRNVALKYISQNHPNPESLMIEIPSDWNQGKYEPSDFFSSIAQRYAEKTQIIPGDRLRYNCTVEKSQGDLDRIVEDIKSSEGLTKIGKAINFIAKTKFKKYFSLLKGDICKSRNMDMEELFQDEQPEVTILGATHAQYIKEKNPDIKYTYIGEDGLVDRILRGKSRYLADETILVDVFNPYDVSLSSDFGKATAGLGLFIGALSISNPALQFGLGFFGSYLFMDNITKGIYHSYKLKKHKEKLKCLKEMIRNS